MALPVIRAAANKASSSVMDSFKNVASQAFIEPFRPLFKNQVIDTIKEIQSDAKVLADKQKDDLEESLESYNQLNDGIESLSDSSTNQLDVLTNILEQVTLHKEMFFDQMTKAAKERALAGRSAREAAIEDAYESPAVPLSDDGGDGKKSGGFMGGIMKFLKGGFMRLAFFTAIPLLIAFFNSDTFKKIGSYLKDKWPAIKEAVGRQFGNLFLFFDDLKDIFTKFFSDESSMSDKYEAIVFELPKAMFDYLRRTADTVISLFGDLIGVDFGKTPVTDFINKITEVVTGAFTAVTDAISPIAKGVANTVQDIIDGMPQGMREALGLQSRAEKEAARLEKLRIDTSLQEQSEAAMTREQYMAAGGIEGEQQRAKERRDAQIAELAKSSGVEPVTEKSGVPDLGINVESLSARDRGAYNRAVQQLQQKRIDEETFRQKVSRFAPDQVSGTTGQIADQSRAPQQATQPGPVIITDNRSTVQDNSRTTAVAGGANKAPVGVD